VIIRGDEDKICVQTLSSPSGQVSMKSFAVKERDRNVGSSEFFHLCFDLQELKVKIFNAKDESLEARLLMRTASSTNFVNASSLIRFRIGHRLSRRQYPRMQRLVGHSCLPLPPHHYAQQGVYAILKIIHSLKCLQIDSFADITTKQSSHDNFDTIIDNLFLLKEKT
jgi:hypothetical protein